MMDEEKAKKFLSAADFDRLDCITDTHSALQVVADEMGRHALAANPNTFDGSNSIYRHEHRGELLGIVDRLLATTAMYAIGAGVASKERDEAKAEVANLNTVLRQMEKSRDNYKVALEQANARVNNLDQYQSYGDLKPWFGGPYAALTLKPEAYDRVFGKHDGVAWSYGGLSHRVGMLEAENKSLRKLADKPMDILDDAQGYYTVNVPGVGQRVSVKDVVKANAGLREYVAGRDQTINRKDAKLVEQQKRIDELEAQVKSLKHATLYGSGPQYRIFVDGHRSFTVDLEGGGQINLAELVSGYERLKKHARTGDDRFVRDGVIIANLAGNLRQTEEDYGDVMVALMDAEERNDVLVRRLDRIEELTDEISDVGVGLKDEELAEDEMMADDEGVSSAVVDNSNPEVYFVDIEIGPGILGCMAKYGKKD